MKFILGLTLMPFVYSLWTVPFRDFVQYKDLLKISKYFIKKQYPDAHIILVTDNKGADICKDLSFTEVSTALEDVSREHHKCWSIGKMFAYQYIAEKYGAFIHLDADVVLTKPLPQDFVDSGIIAQSPEHFDLWNFYDIANKYMKYPGIETYKAAPNMGITGGTDAEFFKSLRDESVTFYNNNKLLLNQEHLHPATAAVMTEQWLTGAFANKLGKKITYLFNDDFPSDEMAREKGYIHLWGQKNAQAVKIKTAELVRGIEE
jgi:hypothetical protein